MSSSKPTDGDLTRLVLALLFIGGLIAASFLVIQPFLAATIWAVTLVIATWPLMIRAQAALGGRRWTAVTVMTIALLLIVLLPLSAAIGAIVAHSDQIAAFIATAPHYRPGPPPTWLADIPLIGRPVADRWQNFADNGARDIIEAAKPYVGTVLQWFVHATGSLGGVFLHSLLTIAIAAGLYATGERAAAWSQRFGHRLAGERGKQVILLAGKAIRSVALGVVGTALAQTVVTGIGLVAAGIPRPGLLTAITLLLCVAQLGPVLVLLPAVIWLFVTGASVSGAVLIVFGVVALTMDNFLRPILIRRGADLPFVLILVGVIGGLLAFGPLGLFLGPVILGVAYTLLQNWIAEAPGPENP
jgi:predicted PurR-regulated permease PerM